MQNGQGLAENSRFILFIHSRYARDRNLILSISMAELDQSEETISLPELTIHVYPGPNPFTPEQTSMTLNQKQNTKHDKECLTLKNHSNGLSLRKNLNLPVTCS